MSTPAARPPSILCFGEMLWDCLPAGLFPGGAPMNVCYHLRALGRSPIMVSAVGDDFLGYELLRRLRSWEVNLAEITVDERRPTGTVQATLDDQGNASYTIKEKVAWDHIPFSDSLRFVTREAGAIVFGSLALREAHNQETLQSVLDTLPPAALRVFDVNLRAPFDDLDLVRHWAARATLVKLNDDEARRLALKECADEELLARDLQAQFPQAAICVTAGAKGAGLLMAGEWFWNSAPEVEVADTIGAGDSFLAALLDGYLDRRPGSKMIERAARLAAHVASSRGATPAYSKKLRESLG